MSTVTPKTELEAVNDMLEAIWEAPVNSLESPVLDDVATAKRILDKTSREVQAKGWHFNTRINVTIPRDIITSKIPVPLNALRFDVSQDDSRDVTQRGRFLYDRTNNTDVFTSDVKAEIVELLAWDDLPEFAKNYITVKAAMTFQETVLGAGQGRVKELEVMDALSTLKEAEGDTADHNILSDNYTAASILER